MRRGSRWVAAMMRVSTCRVLMAPTGHLFVLQHAGSCAYLGRSDFIQEVLWASSALRRHGRRLSAHMSRAGLDRAGLPTRTALTATNAPRWYYMERRAMASA